MVGLFARHQSRETRCLNVFVGELFRDVGYHSKAKNYKGWTVVLLRLIRAQLRATVVYVGCSMEGENGMGSESNDWELVW